MTQRNESPFTLDPANRVGTLRMRKEWFGPDGKLDAAGRERVRKLMIDQADAERLPPAQREDVLAQIDALVGRLGTDGVRKTSLQTVLDTLEHASVTLAGLGDGIQGLAMTAPTRASACEMAGIAAMLSAGRALLETSKDRIDHVLNCGCEDRKHDQADADAETIPPPAPEAPAAEAP